MNIALILSGGTGTRLGADIPKQYIEVGGKPIICYCVEQLLEHDRIDAVQIVADQSWQDLISDWISDSNVINKFKGFSLPGENRQLSIFNGLENIRKYASDDDFVLIHDAARPLISKKMISSCVDAVAGYDGVLPVLPMKDTVYLSVDGKKVDSLIDRNQIHAGQAPEIFNFGKYFEANKQLLPSEILKINGSTEPAIMAGMNIALIPGDERNFKITTKADLERFREIIKKR